MKKGRKEVSTGHMLLEDHEINHYMQNKADSLSTKIKKVYLHPDVSIIYSKYYPLKTVVIKFEKNVADIIL